MAVSDWKVVFRTLRASPGFAAAAVLTLALGVGVNSAMFTIINALMLRPLPFRNPDRLAILYVNDNRPADAFSSNLNRRKLFADGGRVERWAELSRSFDSIGGYRAWRLTAKGRDTAERLNAVIVLGDLFRVMGVSPSLGRAFTKEEMRPDGARVVILSHAYWARRFGGDPGALGRTLELDGYSYTIVGVMPAGFAPTLPGMPRYADVWTTPMADFTAGMFRARRRFTGCQAIGRLKTGVSFTQAQAEMDAIAKSMESENRRFAGTGVNVVRAQDELAEQLRPALLVLFAAVGCVLLIACANIAGLTLARQAARKRDVAIRAVLGASRWRVARQWLAESLLISSAGGAIGLALTNWLLKALTLVSPIEFAKMADLKIDGPVLLFTFVISLVAGLLFGLLPAIAASRIDLNSAIKDAAASPGGRGAFSTRSVLVAAEVGLAVALLAGAGLLVRSFILLRGVDAGFETRNVIAAALPLPETKYAAAAKRQALFDALNDRLSRIPGVEAVGFTNSMALAGTFMMTGDFTVEGQPKVEPEPMAGIVAASPGYFRATAIPLVAGRYYTEAEATRGDVVLINQSAERRYFADGRAIGHRIRFTGCKSCEIVGVVGDIKNHGLKDKTLAEIYTPLANEPSPSLDLVVRTHSDPGPLAPAIRAEVLAIAPDLAIDRIRTMQEVLASHTAQPRFNAMLLGLFAGLALMLAAIGVFGVTAYSVAQRTREIGVRMALGAPRRAVLAMVLRRALLVGCAGIAAGTAASYWTTRVLRTLLFGVPPHDALTFAAVALLMLVITMAAAWAPARRATRVDPMAALRCE